MSMDLRSVVVAAMTAAIAIGTMITCAADEKTKPSIAKGTPEAPANAKAVEGSYYRGNGLSYNLELKLKPDGDYTAEWDSCLYPQGKAAGKWRLSGGRITLMPAIEGKMLRKSLQSLNVLRFQGEWILVSTNEQDQKLYNERGVTPLSCFQRIHLAGTWHHANGVMGEFHTLELHRHRRFTWIFKDEPLHAEDTHHGEWQIHNGSVHLTFTNGYTKEGKPISPRQPTMVLSIIADQQALVQPDKAGFRLERRNVKQSRH